VKAVSDLYSPVTGEVVEANTALEQKPELINQDPYGQGWMIVVKVRNAKELKALMTAEQYTAFLEKGAK
jgi:glycine cleavage system H protein